MNCFYHEDRQAVYTCDTCGKPLCNDCAYVIDPAMCSECIAKCDQNAKKEMTMTLLIGAAISIVFYLLTQDIMSAFFFCVPFGWIALSRITPKLFLFLPIAGWVIYFIIKLFLSVLIGWFVFFYKMYQWIRTIVIAKEIFG